jgi:hypothetical protein
MVGVFISFCDPIEWLSELHVLKHLQNTAIEQLREVDNLNSL